MRIKTLLLTAAAAAMLSATVASAQPMGPDPDQPPPPPPGPGMHGPLPPPPPPGPRMHNPDGPGPGDWHGPGRRDRYWREGYNGYRDGDVFYRTLRARGFQRWDGAPYWDHGRYVIRAYDRRGRAVFVEMNPYTGRYIGRVRF